MAVVGQDDATVVAHAAAAVVGRLDQRMPELTGEILQMLVAEIEELRGDAQLLQLFRDSIEGNVATVFSAIRHAIPIEKVELPTAAVEHARRLAQRGTTVNALVRAYRLGHKAVLDGMLGRDSGVGPGAAAEPGRLPPDLRSHVRLYRLDHPAGGEHISNRARPLDGEPEQPCGPCGSGSCSTAPTSTSTR